MKIHRNSNSQRKLRNKKTEKQINKIITLQLVSIVDEFHEKGGKTGKKEIKSSPNCRNYF